MAKQASGMQTASAMRDRIDLRKLISREHEPAEKEEVDVGRPRILILAYSVLTVWLCSSSGSPQA